MLENLTWNACLSRITAYAIAYSVKVERLSFKSQM